MADCELDGCTGTDDLGYTCSYCDETFCSDHRLPERHNCVWLKVLNTLGPDFRQMELESLQENFESKGNDEMVDVAGEAQRISRTTAKKETGKCKQCGDFTTPNNEHCLDCRRHQETMTYSSPDVAPDGSIEHTEPPIDDEQIDSGAKKSGLVSRILSQLKLR